MNLTSALSSLAASSFGRDLTDAIPAALVMSATGATPAASALVGAAIAASSTSVISDLGHELSHLGTSVIDGLGTAVSDTVSGIEKAVRAVYTPIEGAVSSVLSKVGSAASSVEGAVAAVTDPLTHGIGSIINVIV